MTAQENYGYFFSKTGLSVRFKILSIWVAASATQRAIYLTISSTQAMRQKGTARGKKLQSIKGCLETL